MTPSPQPEDGEELLVPFDRVSKFVRQLTHDLRNGLSAIDLEAAYVAELVTDPEAGEEVRKLRQLVSKSARSLRELSQCFQPISLHTLPWEAALFVEELGKRIRTQFPQEGEWSVVSRLEKEYLCIDLEQMVIAISAVFHNAFRFRPEGTAVRLTAAREGEEIVLEFQQAKQTTPGDLPPEQWGAEPFLTGLGSGYGLGLYRARAILEAHGGRMESFHRNEETVVRLILPVCEEPVE
ncbi:MAG TPA: ATP-binding protein [Chthoniobacteraceae bacterium]|nr:ATP-binding protein [Chthoniobacteraceae bacterium]